MTKVSRERVGTELDGMLFSTAPVRSLLLLHTVGLLPVLFTPPFACTPCDAMASEPAAARAAPIDSSSPGVPWSAAISIVEGSAAALSALSVTMPDAAAALADPSRFRAMLMSALLIGYTGYTYSLKAGRSEVTSRWLMKEGIKVPWGA